MKLKKLVWRVGEVNSLGVSNRGLTCSWPLLFPCGLYRNFALSWSRWVPACFGKTFLKANYVVTDTRAVSSFLVLVFCSLSFLFLYLN